MTSQTKNEKIILYYKSAFNEETKIDELSRYLNSVFIKNFQYDFEVIAAKNSLTNCQLLDWPRLLLIMLYYCHHSNRLNFLRVLTP